MQVKRSSVAIVCGLAAGLLLGCQDEEVRQYKAPRAEHPSASPNEQTPVRLLAAIFPRPDRTWFFKLSGPEPAVDKEQAAFDSFIRSVHFTDQPDQPVTWTEPKGWRRQENKQQVRYATFHLGPDAAPLELTVVALGAEASDVLANVNRWRGQIGLAPIREAELDRVTKQVEVNDVRATVVDMTGPGGADAKMTPPFARGRTRPAAPFANAAPQRPPTYHKPEGWQQQPPGSMSVATFHVSDGTGTAEVTIVPLPGPAGGLLGNVNRWRGQLHLEPVSEAELRKEVQPIDVAGTQAEYVDLLGPEGAGPRERILGVVLSRDGTTWFFKMKGPAELVGNQKAAFEAFVRSVRFSGGEGGNHG